MKDRSGFSVWPHGATVGEKIDPPLDHSLILHPQMRPIALKSIMNLPKPMYIQPASAYFMNIDIRE